MKNITKMNFTSKCKNAALILSLLTICGCEKTYDFNKDIKYRAVWSSGLDYAKDAENRLAALPASGVIFSEFEEVAHGYSTPERQNKIEREDFGRMLSYYYWKVSFKDETITPRPPSLKRECWLYKVSFTVSDKKTVNDGRTNLTEVNLSPSSSGSTTSRGQNEAVSGISAVPGTWVYKDGVSAEVRFTFREDGGYMVYINNTGSESTSYGKWRADGKNGNNINFYDDGQPMLGAVGGATFPSGRTMRIGYGMVGVQTYRKQ